MKKIEKGPEPQAWTQHCATPGAVYESIPELRIALYEEQGGICAYCGRRLFDEHLCRQQQSTNVIEHVIPRESLSDNGINGINGITELSYSNMVLSCCGTYPNTKPVTCDESKGDTPISFSPTDNYFYGTLTFNSSGIIKSSDKKIQNDIDKTLNLNAPILVRNRKACIQGVNDYLKKKGYNRGDITRLINLYSTMKDGVYNEYAGEVVGYLIHKLNTQIR